MKDIGVRDGYGFSLKTRGRFQCHLDNAPPVFKSLIAKLQNKFHVSAAETDEQDVHQIIVIGVAFIVPDNAFADSAMEEISTFVEENTEAEIIGEEREIR